MKKLDKNLQDFKNALLNERVNIILTKRRRHSRALLNKNYTLRLVKVFYEHEGKFLPLPKQIQKYLMDKTTRNNNLFVSQYICEDDAKVCFGVICKLRTFYPISLFTKINYNTFANMEEFYKYHDIKAVA